MSPWLDNSGGMMQVNGPTWSRPLQTIDRSLVPTPPDRPSTGGAEPSLGMTGGRRDDEIGWPGPSEARLMMPVPLRTHRVRECAPVGPRCLGGRQLSGAVCGGRNASPARRKGLPYHRKWVPEPELGACGASGERQGCHGGREASTKTNALGDGICTSGRDALVLQSMTPGRKPVECEQELEVERESGAPPMAVLNGVVAD